MKQNQNIKSKAMKDSDYCCINSAFHGDLCCNSCWNLHPKHDPEKHGMFLGTPEQLSIVYSIWMKKAIESGFTAKQANFLYKQI